MTTQVNYNENLEKFWNNCNRTFAHLEINDYLGSQDKLFGYWKGIFLDNIDFNDKVVLDYGIGGGYLGKILLDKYNIKGYIGLDISERSLAKASENLSHYSKKIKLLKPNLLSTLKPDIIVSQACIQHFPDIDYLNNFLTTINKLNARKIVLQIRVSPYVEFITDNVTLSCGTNHQHVSSFLQNYTLTRATEIENNCYQYLIYSSSSNNDYTADADKILQAYRKDLLTNQFRNYRGNKEVLSMKQQVTTLQNEVAKLQAKVAKFESFKAQFKKPHFLIGYLYKKTLRYFHN